MIQEAVISHFAQGGATISKFTKSQDLFTKIKQSNIIFIQLGENDISPVTSTDEVIQRIKQFVIKIRSANPDIVLYWGQLLQRKKCNSGRIKSQKAQDAFNTKVYIINKALKSLLKSDTANRFWKHVGASEHGLDMLSSDGTHLNSWGSYKLWRSIRGAIMNACKCKFFTYLRVFQVHSCHL